MSAVIVSYKSQKLEIPITPTDRLGDIASRCAECTGVPVERMKLLSSGDSPAQKRKRSDEAKTSGGGDFFGSLQRAFGSVARMLEGDFGTANESLDAERSQNPHTEGRVNVLGMDDVRGSYIWMKDMNASLQHYGIKTGSRIMMLGDAAAMPKAPVTVPTAVSAPTSALEKIEEIALKSTTATTPLVNEYLDSVSKYTSKDTPKSERATAKKMQDSHSRASEILLQDLLKIDGVNIPEGDDEARSRRRAVVKMMNTQLDRLDAAREAVKAFETASNTQANAGSGDVADNSKM